MLGGGRARKLPLKVGLADTPPALPPALPSSTQRGQEDQHPAWLCRHHPTPPCLAVQTPPHFPLEVHCLLPRGKVGAQLPAWGDQSSRGGRWEFFPWYLAAVRVGTTKKVFCCYPTLFPGLWLGENRLYS